MVRSLLAKLLHPTVKVAYLGTNGHDDLTVEIELCSVHPMHRGMLGAHADGHDVTDALQPPAGAGLAFFEFFQCGTRFHLDLAP
jgi:hypothetical protein